MEGAHKYHAFLIANILSHAASAEAVLDFGAGTGTHARVLRDEGFDVSCVEPDPGLRLRLERDGFRVAGRASDFGTQTFDLIYALNVLEHIDDDEAALGDLFTALRPRGRLVLYVPAFQILFSAMDSKVGHHRRYRADQLSSIVQAGGFRVLTCAYADSLGFMAALIYRLFGGSGDLSRRSVAFYDQFFPVSRVVDRLTHRWLGKNLLMVATRD